jgi:hypothetical protein
VGNPTYKNYLIIFYSTLCKYNFVGQHYIQELLALAVSCEERGVNLIFHWFAMYFTIGREIIYLYSQGQVQLPLDTCGNCGHEQVWFVTLPSSRIKACICNYIMWIIFNLQKKNKQ